VALFIADNRGHHHVLELLEEAGAEVLTTRLEAGDVSFLAHGGISVGVELKASDDLLSSLRSGRLFEQSARMILTYESSLLLPFGFLTVTKQGYCRTRTGVKVHPPWPTYTQLTNALLSISKHGVTVLPIAPNKYTAAQVLVSIHSWFQKERHESLMKRRMPFAMGNQDDIRAIHIVTGCPRVSVELAKRLLAELKTPLAVLSASQEELRTVKGIGKVTARSIYQAAHAEYGKGNGSHG